MNEWKLKKCCLLFVSMEIAPDTGSSITVDFLLKFYSFLHITTTIGYTFLPVLSLHAIHIVVNAEMYYPLLLCLHPLFHFYKHPVNVDECQWVCVCVCPPPLTHKIKLLVTLLCMHFHVRCCFTSVLFNCYL